MSSRRRSGADDAANVSAEASAGADEVPLVTSESPALLRVAAAANVHAASNRKVRNRLIIASVLCVVFMGAEIAGGFIANSLAILTDAAHLLSDLGSFLISLFAIYLTSRPTSKTMSFGYYRAEIIGALCSIMLIWGVTGILVYEAIQRIINPSPIDGGVMLITAACGIVFNLVMCAVLASGGSGGGAHGHSHGGGHGHSHGLPCDCCSRLTRCRLFRMCRASPDSKANINLRAAFIHALGDLVQSVGVCIAAVIIMAQPTWEIADPICTFLFSVLVLLTTIRMLRDSVQVLMEGVPRDINLEQVEAALLSIPGVVSTHNVHIWALTTNKNALTAHVDVDAGVDEQAILLQAQRLVCHTFNIHATTIQVDKHFTTHCNTLGDGCDKKPEICEDSCRCQSQDGTTPRIESSRRILAAAGGGAAAADAPASSESSGADAEAGSHHAHAHDHGHSHGSGHSHDH